MKNYGPYPYQERSLSNLPSGAPRRQPWTGRELTELNLSRANGETIGAIAAKLGRTYYSVQSKIAQGGY